MIPPAGQPHAHLFPGERLQVGLDLAAAAQTPQHNNVGHPSSDVFLRALQRSLDLQDGVEWHKAGSQSSLAK